MTTRVVRRLLVATAFLLSITGGARAQGTAAPAPVPCSQAEYRQFDFWVGDWEVQTPDGKPAGTNLVTNELGGCVIHEHWKGAGGGSGESFNHYAAGTKHWYQTWVDDQAGSLLLSGSYEKGVMSFTGTTPTVRGDTVLHRLSFERVNGDPDRVHQLWQTSRDRGKTWTVAFDGIYIRKK
jgi:hypothetical protein